MSLISSRASSATAASEDVIHSFWAPRRGGKIDAIPGHDAMRFEVHAHPAEAYEAVLAGLSGKREAAR